MYCGPYRLLSLVSYGKATEIWEAIQDSTRRKVAIKKLRPDSVDAEQTAFLRHEYVVGRTLRHERVIAIEAYDVHKNEPYLMMELFRVPNLKTLVTQGVARIAPIIGRIIDQSSEALEYLSSRGWVHRDIKPDNFLVAPEGDVKLIDFALAVRKKTGLSKLFSGRAKIQGTLSYMSPEQIRGRALDSQADVYSYACTLYEALGGKPPFTGMSATELLNKHLRGSPPSLEVANRNITPEFAQLLKKMLAKRPDDRPTISEFRSEFKVLSLFKSPPSADGQKPQQVASE
jgi:serine/threonine protein kinase